MKPIDYSDRVAYRPPPPSYARMQWLGVVLTSLGLAPSDAVTLEVRGRTSGKSRRTPVVCIDTGTGRFLVSLAGESAWVRNVRAANGEAVIHRRGATRVSLVEVPAGERIPAIRAYIARSGAATETAAYYFGLGPDPSDAEIAAVARYYPVFGIQEVPGTVVSGARRHLLRVAVAVLTAAAIGTIAATLRTRRSVTADRRIAGSLRLDPVLPDHQFSSVYSTVVRATPMATYRAARDLRAGELGAASRALLAVRAGPAGRRVWRSLSGERPLLEVVQDLGFVLLLDDPGREIVLGVVGRFWRPLSVDVQRITSLRRFRRFDDAKYARAVVGFATRPDPSGGAVLQTETRVDVPDPNARRRFARYWSVVRFGSGFLRRRWVRAIARRAERAG